MSPACAVAVPRFQPGHSARPRFAGVVRMELQLALRESSLPLVVIGLLAFCQLLMPPPDAPYAVITVNNLKPLMSAGAMLVATGAVFSAIAFPAYLLYLGRGRSRDLAARVAPLYLSAPASAFPHAVRVTSGRLVANLLLAWGSLWIVLPLLVASAFLKTGEWPGGIALAAYFALSTPVVLAAACAAAILDAALSGNALKSAGAFGLWFALLLASVSFQKFDFFGLRFIGENILPGQRAPSLSVGFIGGNVPTVPWGVVHETADHLLSRLQLTSAIAAIAAVTSCGLAASFRSRYSLSRARSSPGAATPTPAVAASPVHRRPAQAVTRRVSIGLTVFLIAQRRLRHAGGAKFLMLIAAALAIAAPQTSHAATIALLVPVALFLRAPTRSLLAERALRFTTPALWRPTPSVLEAVALWGLVAVPVLPGLGRGGASWLQGAHFLIGAFAGSAWMVLTHQVLARELLGVSTYLLVWYFVACHRLPATLDVLGVHGTSTVAFAGALAAAVLACVALAQGDSRRR